VSRQRIWIAAFWLAVFAGIVLSLMPAPPLHDPWFPAADKLQHAVAYGLLFLLGGLAGYRARPLAVGLIALGAVIEVAQGTLTATRSAEWLDLAADAVGVGLGHAIALAVERYRSSSAGLEQVHRR
jgi:hypothetical protein